VTTQVKSNHEHNSRAVNSTPITLSHFPYHFKQINNAIVTFMIFRKAVWVWFVKKRVNIK